MRNRRISALAAVVTTTGFGFAAACSSSNGGGGPSSSSSTTSVVTSTGHSTGGSSSSSSGSTGSSGSSGSGTSSDAGSSGSSSSGSSSSDAGVDAGPFTPPCTASAAGLTLIDDQSQASTQITFSPTFAPASCGTTGRWFSFPSGTTTTPSNPFTFSPLPAPLPSDAGTTTQDATLGDAAGDAGDGSVDATADAAMDASGGDADAAMNGDAGVSGPMAACLSGMTGATAYSTSGMGFNFGSTSTAIPVTINASSHTGVTFWIWGGDGGPQTLSVLLPDVNQTPGFGAAATPTASGRLCDSASTGNGTACGAARAFITVQPGWQSVSVPFTSFAEMTGYSSSNETMLDTTTLTGMAWWAQASGTPDGGVPYDFCVYRVSFY